MTVVYSRTVSNVSFYASWLNKLSGLVKPVLHWFYIHACFWYLALPGVQKAYATVSQFLLFCWLMWFVFFCLYDTDSILIMLLLGSQGQLLYWWKNTDLIFCEVFKLWIHIELVTPVNSLINVCHDTIKTRRNFMGMSVSMQFCITLKVTQ